MPLVLPGLSKSSCTTPTPTSSSSSQDSVFDVNRYTENPVPERSGSTSEELRGILQHKPTENETKNKNERREEVQSDLLHDLPDWLQDSREILVDERSPTEPRRNLVPEDRDTASSSHELAMESRVKVAPGSGKHSIYTHFPKDPNCDICLKTKITRASCRRRTGTVVPREENFGNLISADHKILSEESESRETRNNHRHAVVVQDLATQWLQSYPCKTKTSQETQKRAWWSSWSRRGNQKSFTLTIPWHLASLVRNYPGIIVRQSHTDQKPMGLLKEQFAEWKKAPLRYCCNQVWTVNGGRIPWNATAICEIYKISCLMGKLHTKDALENPLKDQSSRLIQSRIHQFGKKVLLGIFLGYALYAGGNLEGWHIGCRHWGVGHDGRIRNLL